MRQADRPGEQRWKARPVISALLTGSLYAVPFIASSAAVLVLARHNPLPGHRWLSYALLAGTAVAVSVLLERGVRHLLPLATLLRMTMLFPDRAPSRFKIAREAATSTRARAQLDATASPGDAAQHALALMAMLGAHDRRTRGHSERVRVFSDMLAAELRLSQDDRDRLRWASLLHDIGKLDVPASVLNKPAKLDRAEFALMKTHPQIGAELTASLLPWLEEWGSGILDHHEKYDGSGYPRGLVGLDISAAGRIIALVDAFETMTSARPYKKAMATRVAREELTSCAGAHFDPAYVRAFLAVSLPRLLWCMGPLSFLLQLPFLRVLAQAGVRTVEAGQVATTVAGATVVASGVVGAAGALPSFADTVPRPAVSVRQPAVVRPDPAPPPRRVSASQLGPPAQRRLPRTVAGPTVVPAALPAASDTPQQPPLGPPAAPAAPVEPVPAGPTVPTGPPAPAAPPAPTRPVGPVPPAAPAPPPAPAPAPADPAPLPQDPGPPVDPKPSDPAPAPPEPASAEPVAPPPPVGPPASAPTVTFLDPPAGTVYDTTVTVGFTSDVASAAFTCSVDGAPAAPCLSPVILTGLPQGAHALTVTATDPIRGSGTATLPFATGSPVLPTVTLAWPVAGVSTQTSTVPSFSSPDTTATFECSLDDAPWTPCVSDVTSFSTPVGATYVLQVRAVDRALQPGPVSSVTFGVVPDDLVITSGPQPSTSDPTAQFTFTAAAGLTFECALVGQFTPCTSGVAFTDLTPGNYTFRVRTVDGGGHRSAVYNWQWRIV